MLDVVTAGRVEDESRVSGQLAQFLDATVARVTHLGPLFRRCAGRLNSLPGSDHNERAIAEWRRIRLSNVRSTSGAVAERSVKLPDSRRAYTPTMGF